MQPIYMAPIGKPIRREKEAPPLTIPEVWPESVPEPQPITVPQPQPA